jgi:hypothetical protein
LARDLASGYLGAVRVGSQRRLIALVLSLIAHAVVLALLLSAPPRQRDLRPDDPDAVAFELFEPPPPVPQAEPAPATESRPQAPEPPKRRRELAASSAPREKPAARPEARHADAAPEASASASAGTAPGTENETLPVAPAAPGAPSVTAEPGRPSDAPAGLPPLDQLGPSFDVAQRYGVGSTTGPGGGTTLRPGDPGTSVADQRASERRVVEDRVHEMLADGIARNRVDTGAVDGYFASMRRSLEKSAAHPPPIEGVTNPLPALVRSFAGAASSFGSTGNPYAGSSTPSTLGSPSRGGPTSVEAHARQQELLDGALGAKIIALVEIRQDATGALLESKLVASSGLPAFDSYVIASIPNAITALPEPAKGAAGIHADGIRSLWAFLGRIKYSTRLMAETDEETAKNMLFLVLGGSFEETTGEVFVNRLDKPQFLCNVKLLSVY